MKHADAGAAHENQRDPKRRSNDGHTIEFRPSSTEESEASWRRNEVHQE